MDKGALLDRLGAAGEERLALSRVLDRYEQSCRRGSGEATDFLTPQQRLRSQELLRLAGAGAGTYVCTGGYAEAERQVILFLPDWLEAEMAETISPIRCLRASFRAEKPLSHRDFLGSLMGMGVAREKVGDILVTAESADILVLDTVADFLLQSWESAGRTRLRLSEVERSCIHIPQASTEEVRDTVSSLRLDAVIAAGLRMYRGKAAELVSSGRVQVNWMECTKADKLLAEGDTVSARGFGKFRLAAVGGTTKKGRISVTLLRYV